MVTLASGKCKLPRIAVLDQLSISTGVMHASLNILSITLKTTKIDTKIENLFYIYFISMQQTFYFINSRYLYDSLGHLGGG